MRLRMWCCVLLVILVFASEVFAQADVGVSGSAVLSIQPTDNWGGGPYLDHGVGGLTPGLGVSLDVTWPAGISIIGEFSTVLAFEQAQDGRFVPTRRDMFHVGYSDTRLRDSLFSGLVGFTIRDWTRLRLVGGVTVLQTTMTLDRAPVTDFDLYDTSYERMALTGGADFRTPLSPRITFVLSGRYVRANRAELASNLGAGRHIIRVGAGVRLGLN